MPDVTQTTTVLKAISDPIRWDIVRQMTEVDELACQTLEQRLPVSKPTISYHIRILAQAGLVSVRKEGRYFFYTLNRKVLRDLVDELWVLAPEPTAKSRSETTEAGAADPYAGVEKANPSLLTW